MILESAQLLCTALWVDKVFGHAPRVLTIEEQRELKALNAIQPADMEQREFAYKSGHFNHPCSIWLRTSVEHFYYLVVLAHELQREAWYRGYATHKSTGVINGLPLPNHTPNTGFTPPYPAMPEELKSGNTLLDYRRFYELDKAAIPATWKCREKPHWWSDERALWHKRYTKMTTAEKREIGYL